MQIVHMIVDSSLPTWEVNLKKAWVSNFQADTCGTGLIHRDGNEKPEGISATYSVMEVRNTHRETEVYEALQNLTLTVCYRQAFLDGMKRCTT